MHVFDPHEPLASRVPRMQPAAERGHQRSGVQRPGRGGCKAPAIADRRRNPAAFHRKDASGGVPHLNRVAPCHTFESDRACRALRKLQMFKRVVLFLATNLAVLALLSVVMSVLHVNPAQFGGLLVMAAIFGFGGSTISL
ncbi:MAG: hypothetical protein ACJ8GK_04225, partial [Luteimonas sp.]